MKKYYSLLLLLLPLITFAQPTMTVSNEAVTGITLTYSYVDSSTAQPGPSGANQTWNFSSVVPNGLTHVDQWLTPASTPYAASFPGSNLVQQTSDTAGNTIYLYHTTSSSMTVLNGMAMNLNGAPVMFNYSNSEILRQYPATYNSTLSDNFTGMFSMIAGPITINNYRSGTYSYTADAYGTLITPSGTFTNTLRGKIRQVITDSIVYAGLPLPAEIIHQYSTSYFWACTNAGFRLYQFYIGYDTIITSTSTVITKSVSFQNTTTGITESLHQSSELSISPNPASDMAVIHVPNLTAQSLIFTLYDVKGSQLFTQVVEVTASGDFQYALPVKNLSAGIYHLRIIGENNLWNANLIKQ